MRSCSHGQQKRARSLRRTRLPPGVQDPILGGVQDADEEPGGVVGEAPGHVDEVPDLKGKGRQVRIQPIAHPNGRSGLNAGRPRVKFRQYCDISRAAGQVLRVRVRTCVHASSADRPDITDAAETPAWQGPVCREACSSPGRPLPWESGLAVSRVTGRRSGTGVPWRELRMQSGGRPAPVAFVWPRAVRADGMPSAPGRLRLPGA